MASPFDRATRLARAFEFVLGEIARELTPEERRGLIATLEREKRTRPTLAGVSIHQEGAVNVVVEEGDLVVAGPAIAHFLNRFVKENGSAEVWELARAVVRDALAQFPEEIQESGAGRLLLGGAEAASIDTGIEGDSVLFPLGLPRAAPTLMIGAHLEELRALGAHFAAGGLEFGKAIFVASYGPGQETLQAIAASGADVETAVAEKRLLVVEITSQPGQRQSRRGAIIQCAPSQATAAVRGVIAEIGNHAPKRAVIQHPRAAMSGAERESFLALVDELRDAGFDVLYEVDAESHRLLAPASLSTRFPVVLEMDRRGETTRLRVREARGVEVGEREAELRLSPNGTLFIATGLEVSDVRPAGMIGDTVRLPKRGLINGGMVNGLVNGRGAVNGGGLTNGKNILQKRGLVNGRGLINGGGLTNGRVLRYGSAIERRVRPKDRAWVVTVLAVAFVIGMPAVFIFLPGDSIVIDGSFSDWSGKRPFDPGTPLISNFLFYHDKGGSNKLFIYVQGTGTLFGGGNQDANSIFAFFSTGQRDAFNGLQQNGFPVHPGWAAQYMVAIHGGGGRIAAASFYIYGGSGGQDSWSSWDGPYDMRAANTGSELEAQLYTGQLGLTNPLEYAGGLVARNAVHTDVTYLVSPGLPGALDLMPIYRDVAVLNGSLEVLNVDMYAKGSDVRLREMRFEVANGSGGWDSLRGGRLLYEGEVLSEASVVDGVLAFPLNFSVPDSRRRTLTVEVTSDTSSGATVSLRLAGALADEAIPTVRLGNQRYWYLGQVPSGILVDGGFADWSGRTPTADDTGDVRRASAHPTPGAGNEEPAFNPNVDIAATDHDRFADRLTLFARSGEAGLMLGGSVVVGGLMPSMTGASSRPPAPTPETPQEDRWYFFLDTDSRSDTGYQVGGVGAELTVNVSGAFSEIRSALVERYIGATQFEWAWEPTGIKVDALADSRNLEAGATLPGLGPSVRVAVLALDWEWQFDVAAAGLLGVDDPVVNAPTDVILNEVCPGATGECGNWIELVNLGSTSVDMTGWSIEVRDADFNVIGTITVSGTAGAGAHPVFTAGFTIPQDSVIRLIRPGSPSNTRSCSTGAGTSCGNADDNPANWSSGRDPDQGGFNASEFPFGAAAALVGTMVMMPLIARRKRRKAH